MAKHKSELRFEAPVPGKDLFFTSDLHFYHKNMMDPDYSGRPFKDVEEMNEVLIANWNAVVGAQDVIFILGDFAMSGPKSATNIARRLNGRKFIVYGNHDLKQRGDSAFESLFEKVIDFGCQIKVADTDAYQQWRRITVCHYAFKTWNKSHWGSWSLYGHSHGNLREEEHSLQMDVGVDAVARRHVEPLSTKWEHRPHWQRPIECRPHYRPVAYAEVKDILSKRKFKPIDHHKDMPKDDE